jgi:beta-aspartyl-peptidase (threonine type)
MTNLKSKIKNQKSTTPVMVASENGRLGLLAAMDLLRQGGSALDAVELACRIVEDDPADHSVGYSGLPNLAGEVELDASIMDGRTLQAGAVAAVKDYGHPISLARRVMSDLPHVLVVARGAERFAQELGEVPANQLTEEALAIWRERFREHNLQPDATADLRALAHELARPLHLQDRQPTVAKDDKLGTVNFIALDQAGNLASAVSTSGIAWKYPGRVGDSPIIGAGNYCDNRYGAAACTGRGELALRVSTARSLVLYMKMSMSLLDAGLEALRDLHHIFTTPDHYMNIVALTPQGEVGGFTTVPGKLYLHMHAEMHEPMLAERTLLS